MAEVNKEYCAHSENKNKEKHLLSAHLHQTSILAESFACKEEYIKIFRLTGLIHDLGKYQPKFQEYLKNGGKRGSVPHASWGAGYARLLRIVESSIAIDGHHKGLPDLSVWKSDTEPYKRNDVPGFENIVREFIHDAQISEGKIEKPEFQTFPDYSCREVFIRYLFSALTDGDWLSTEEHFEKGKFDARAKMELPIDIMLERLEREFSSKPKDTEINRLRNQAREQALQKSDLPPGFYSLALPTGIGKTLTSMAWALRHAKKNGLKRVIIVLPYINIIDQTAKIFKDIFGEEWVLEHHSSYNEDNIENKDKLEHNFLTNERKKLACENWEYPIIVTTTVQFFESLFSNSPSQCRKVHNIAESVVIFDEVQTLPKEIIEPTLQMLEGVQSVMRTSFLFCTATQPAFLKRPGFKGINKITTLIENPAFLYEKTKRVKYYLLNNLAPIDYDYLHDSIIQAQSSVLIIFNTKKAALEFYQLVKDLLGWDRKYHLSTAMCPNHRKKFIRNITDDLKAGMKILVVSTQLIEAGVDFDFPVVFRAMGPLEGDIQAAGRCNREGKLGEMGGKVYLFKLWDNAMPDKTYAACADYAEELIKQDINQLYEHDIFNRYYDGIIRLFVDPDKYKINEARERFDFETVNDAYHIIDKPTVGLFIYNYSDESRRLLHSLESKEFLSKDDFRKMQAFTVNVYQDFILENKQMCNTLTQGFTVWYGNYNAQTGISKDPLEADKSIA